MLLNCILYVRLIHLNQIKTKLNISLAKVQQTMINRYFIYLF